MGPFLGGWGEDLCWLQHHVLLCCPNVCCSYLEFKTHLVPTISICWAVVISQTATMTTKGPHKVDVILPWLMGERISTGYNSMCCFYDLIMMVGVLIFGPLGSNNHNFWAVGGP
jgi:hypothetical protein